MESLEELVSFATFIMHLRGDIYAPTMGKYIHIFPYPREAHKFPFHLGRNNT